MPVEKGDIILVSAQQLGETKQVVKWSQQMRPREAEYIICKYNIPYQVCRPTPPPAREEKLNAVRIQHRFVESTVTKYGNLAAGFAVAQGYKDIKTVADALKHFASESPKLLDGSSQLAGISRRHQRVGGIGGERSVSWS